MTGHIMISIDGTSLTEEESIMLQNPNVCGIVFFARNYENPSQCRVLVDNIRAINKDLVITVDHEGGRVQRFYEDFTKLPYARAFGDAYDVDVELGLRAAFLGGWLMASEVQAVGVDASLAPCMDIDTGLHSKVIGRRSFHDKAKTSVTLLRAYLAGMRAAGMVGTGKHFPGHGAVVADSHFERPVDQRPYEEIFEKDMLPFRALCRVTGAKQPPLDVGAPLAHETVAAHMEAYNGLEAVMPAHIIYTDVDPKLTAGSSPRWLQQELREVCGFEGVTFTDDLTMAAADVVGEVADRLKLALAAGADICLVCNNRPMALEALKAAEALGVKEGQAEKLARLRGKFNFGSLEELRATSLWKEAVEALKAVEEIALKKEQ